MGVEAIYQVQGSSPEPYIIKIDLDNFTISCTCTAAEHGLPCKHRIKILSGENPGIIQGDISLLPKLAQWANGTNIFDIIQTYETAKNELKNAHKKMDYAFKNYRDARIQLLLKQKKNDKAVIRTRDTLEATIDEGLPAEQDLEAIHDELSKVFIRPVYEKE
ncbi:hypothetical protein AGMMS49944_09480 [Spirochaetia bacterium]|nr:hypothetical protein AGMMS49944_09480 [Spirochaetia bacterium]